MARVFIDGLSLENFRAVGSRQKIGSFDEINLFIGPNNSGKSSILAFIAKYLGAQDGSGRRWARSYAAIDVHLNKIAEDVRFGIGVLRKTVDTALIQKIGGYEDSIKKILDALTTDGLVWLSPIEGKQSLGFLDARPPDLAKIIPQYAWNQLWQRLFPTHSGGALVEHWIPQILLKFAGMVSPSIPSAKFIPAIRQIGPTGQDFKDFSGVGLIDKLAEHQNPPHDERVKEEKFSKINTFLKTITECADARIEVPFDRRHLLVHMNGKVLPLDSFGTGIHEVVMLASFCTLTDDEIICIEEPEIHLHPLLQRKLIRYLRDNTTNQYFIATHSASVMDAVKSSVFSVTSENVEARVVLASGAGQRFDLCRSLGYRASDILQANSIIWVEGPSDRIYLNWWIRAIDGGLIEGLDYSIMFYGGRLLSHLSADDAEVSDFILLRRLNRNSFIVIDSDRRSAHTKINATKSRVASEFGGDSWITSGREIENYLSEKAVLDALEFIKCGGASRPPSSDRYAPRLQYVSIGGKELTADKVKVAKIVSQKDVDWSVLDLRRRVEAIVDFIRKASL